MRDIAVWPRGLPTPNRKPGSHEGESDEEEGHHGQRLAQGCL